MFNFLGMKKKTILFLALISIATTLYAQEDGTIATNDHDLALQYYNGGEFDKLPRCLLTFIVKILILKTIRTILKPCWLCRTLKMRRLW